MFPDRPLAIVSMACRLPGANSLDEYWEMIREGSSAIGELPPERLNQRLYYDENRGARSKTYSRIGGIVRHDEQLSPDLMSRLGLNEHDLRAADKAHLELLGVAIDAIQDAGWDPADVPQKRAGVFIGHTRGTGRSGDMVYRSLIAETANYLRDVPLFLELSGSDKDRIIESVIQRTRDRYPGRDSLGGPNLEAFQAGRIISKALRLDGPYMAMNAACASSLYALAAGSLALQLGELDMAIIGGASHCKFDSLLLFSKAGSVSATGSRPFDADADGLVTAEGYVILVLKTLERALADGDKIDAVIRGVGFSSDGRGKSLWAPRQEGQIEAIRRAYGDHLRFDRLQYIEAHATSTPVGDATEVTALARGLSGRLPAGRRIPIGSVKANIGHTLETAGLAGLVKTVLALKAKQIPPAPNVQNPNPKVDWARTPFELPSSLQPWPEQSDGSPRRAGVNAFGIGGLNAHVVVDEYVPNKVQQYACIEAGPSQKSGASQSSADPDVNALAIVGVGAILPGAVTWDAFWRRTLEGQTGIVPVAPERFSVDRLPKRPATLYGGFLNDYQYDWKKHKVPPKQIAGADPLQFMLLDAVDQALVDSGYKERPFDSRRAGVIVGSLFGGEFGNQLQMGMRLHEFMDDVARELRQLGVTPEQIHELTEKFGDRLLEKMPAMLDETGSFTSSTLASRCTKTFDLMGGATAIDSGDASGLAAVHLASLMLRSGHVDMMIVGAGQRSAGFTTFDAMMDRDRLSPDGHVQPLFAPGRTVPGEGVGVVILKRLESARRDGDKIHGVVRGVGVASGNSASDIVQRSIREAICRAGEPSLGKIGLIESSANGDSKIDSESWQGIVSAFAEDKPCVSIPVRVRTLVESVGSLSGATMMASLIRATQSVESGRVAPQIHQAPQGLVLGGRPVGLETKATELPRFDDGNMADAMVCGTNGNTLAYAAIVSNVANMPSRHQASQPAEQHHGIISQAAAHTVSSNCPTVAVAAERSNELWRTVLIGAPTVSELLAKLENVASDPKRAFDAATSRLDGVSRYVSDDRFRLGIVAQSSSELAEKIQPAWRGIQLDRNLGHLAVQGIHFGVVASEIPCSLAILLPGQGAQYAGMLDRMVEVVPESAESLANMNQTLAELGQPSFEQITADESGLLGRDIFRTQLSVLLADSLMIETLSRWGVRPSVAIGHSFGEFAAMYAGGVWDFATAVEATRKRCESIASAQLPQAAMVSIIAERPVLQHILSEIGGSVWLANFNTSEQIVAGGTIEAVQRLEARLTQEKIRFKRLAVPCAFHTPLLAPAQSRFGTELEPLAVSPSKCPILSTVSGCYESDGLRLKAGLVHQLVSPVPFVDVIQRALNDGVRTFVEAGPGQVLSGLVRRIATGRDDSVALAMDHPTQGVAKSLACVHTLLATNGLLDDTRATTCLARLGSTSTFARTLSSDLPATEHVDAPDIGPLNVVRSDDPVCDHGRTIVGPHFEPSLVHKEHAGDVPSSTIATAVAPARLGLAAKVRHQPRSVVTDLQSAQASKHLRLVELEGTPREMGRQLGESERDRIGELLELAAGTFAHDSSKLKNVTDAMAHREKFWGPDEWEELVGVSEGSGISVENLAVWNFWLYPDIDAGCAHFVVPSESGHSFWHGANEDLPLGLTLRGPLPRSVAVRRPSNAMTHVQFGVSGQIGSIAGMNASGLSVSSSMLLDRPVRSDNRYGVLHGLLVGRILSRCQTIDQATGLIQAVQRRGAWGLTLLESNSGRRVYLEYDGAQIQTHEIRNSSFVVSNHSQLLSPIVEAPQHSVSRLGRLADIFPATASRFSLGEVQRALRDRLCPERGRFTPHPTMHTLRRVDNQASIVMAPGDAKIWLAISDPAIAGVELERQSEPANCDSTSHSLPSDDQYCEIDLSRFGFARHRRQIDTFAGPAPAVKLDAGDQPFRSESYVNASQHEQTFILSPKDYIELATEIDGHSPLGASERTCVRLVNRMIPMPLSETVGLDTGTVRELLSPGVILLGVGTLSAEIESRLRSLRIPVHCFDLDEPMERLAERFDAITADGLPTHLLLLDCVNNRSEIKISQDAYALDRERLVTKVFQLCQAWHAKLLQSKRTSEASLFSVISTAGDFGLSGELGSVADGAMTGLIKAVRLETRSQTRDGFVCSVLDMHPALAVSHQADLLLRELCSRVKDVEVGFDAMGTRFAQKCVHQPVERRAARDGQELGRSAGAWVITGGARGVTAAVAEGLGCIVNGTLHLIGSSPIPKIDPAWCDLDDTELRELRSSVMREAVAAKLVPADQWLRVEKAIEITRTLRKFEAAGIRCRYWVGDVSRRDQMASLLDRIRELGEPIVGVVHGAGFEKASKFSSKKLNLVNQTIGAKVDGCVALMDLTLQDPVRWFVTFGSISGRFGGIGQVDYCLANEMATKLTNWYRARRPETRVVTLAWHSWDEVGMAVRPETKHAKVMSKMSFMPVREGVEHLIDELLSGSTEPEVTITDWRHYKLFTPDPVWPPTLSIPTWPPAIEDAQSNQESSVVSHFAVEPISQVANTTGTEIARRFVMQMDDRSLIGPEAHELAGLAVVVGNNPDARTIVEAFGDCGLPVRQIVATTLEEALADFESILSTDVPRHLVIATGRDDDAWTYTGTVAWNARVDKSIMLAFTIVQTWVRASVKANIALETLSAVTCLGGDFGIRSRPLAPEGGAIAGLLKSVRVELSRRQSTPIRVKIVDSSPGLASTDLAKSLMRELTSSDPSFEVAVSANTRRVPIAHPAPVAPSPDRMPNHGEVWVAAGGGRGITAGVALRLAERFSLKMHVLGRTVPREIPEGWLDADAQQLASIRRQVSAEALTRGEKSGEVWKEIATQIELQQNLRQARRKGAEITYHVCDITDRHQLATTLQQIRTSDGHISGVIQGAGVTYPDRIENKKLDRVRQMVHVKLSATQWLIELTRQDPLKYFIGFGSISGRMGGNGASDYALGADGMCKLIGALRHQRPGIAAVSFHWHSWGEAGMMTRSTSFGGRSIMKLALMPIDEGVTHILRELAAGAPDAEVVITDDTFFEHVGAEAPKAFENRTSEATPKSSIRELIELHSSDDPFLREHLFKGEPLMPLVASIEMTVACAKRHAANVSVTPYRLRNIRVVNRLAVPSGQERQATILLDQKADYWDAQLCSDQRTRQGKLVESDRLMVSLEILGGGAGTECERPTPTQPLQWYTVAYKDNDVIHHGPPFRALTHLAVDSESVWGRLVAPDPSELLGQRHHLVPNTPMAILDSCLFASGLTIWINDKNVFGIPIGIDQLSINRVPERGEELVVRVVLASHDQSQASLDFIVLDQQGACVIAAAGYRCALVKGQAK